MIKHDLVAPPGPAMFAARVSPVRAPASPSTLVSPYSDTEFKLEGAVSKPAFVRQVGGLDFVPGKK